MAEAHAVGVLKERRSTGDDGGLTGLIAPALNGYGPCISLKRPAAASRPVQQVRRQGARLMHPSNVMVRRGETMLDWNWCWFARTATPRSVRSLSKPNLDGSAANVLACSANNARSQIEIVAIRETRLVASQSDSRMTRRPGLGGSEGTGQFGDFLDMSDRSTTTGGFGEQVERFVSVVADRGERLVHITTCVRVACDHRSPH
jgi:hypothetical protein